MGPTTDLAASFAPRSSPPHCLPALGLLRSPVQSGGNFPCLVGSANWRQSLLQTLSATPASWGVTKRNAVATEEEPIRQPRSCAGKYGGRLVKLTGDGALIEFASAVDALSAAIEFQQTMVEANADQLAGTALVYRMGLHLGDLIVDGDDLYGDGVNIAARLEAEAPAGGIVISRTVHEAVMGRVKATFDDLGSLP